METLKRADIEPDTDTLASRESVFTQELKREFHKDIELSRRKTNAAQSGISPRLARFASLMLGDFIALLISAAISYGIATIVNTILKDTFTPISVGPPHYVLSIFAMSAAVMFWCSWSWGHYTRFRPSWIELKEIFKLCVYIGAINIAILFALKQPFSRMWLCSLILCLGVLVPLGRSLVKKSLMSLEYWYKSTYVVGTGANAIATAVTLASDSALGYRVDGFVDLSGSYSSTHILGKPVFQEIPAVSLGKLSELPCAVFAFESLKEMNTYRAELSQYLAMSPFATISPPVNGLPLYGAEIMNVLKCDTVLLKIQNNINNRQAEFIKRIFDIVVSSIALLLLSPLFLILALLISRDGSSCIYGHRRVGKNGIFFNCLKFRSMNVNSEMMLNRHLDSSKEAREEWESSQKLRNDPRITEIGKFIRATSMDELPQLFNVLRGEMSLVGPRPIVTDEAKHYDEYFPYYLSILPGITGLWQTSGRSDTTYKERVQLDVWYSRNWSLWLDVVIVLRTVPSLLKRTGAR